MKKYLLLLICLGSAPGPASLFSQKIFDVHLHATPEIPEQLQQLKAQRVYAAAVSTSWQLQDQYRNVEGLRLLRGLMFPCPNGKVPYTDRPCFEDGADFPDPAWVEEQMKNGSMDFMGEILAQYYGISPSDEALFPYYALAEKYGIPVGIHSGLAGPNHGSPDFRVSLGTPLHLEGLLQKFPKLKVWIMHAGIPFQEDCLAIMLYYRNVYADISAIANPRIIPPAAFAALMQAFINAGLEDRLMFGSDNAEVKVLVENIDRLDFLTEAQKEKIFFRNAETFFGKGN